MDRREFRSPRQALHVLLQTRRELLALRPTRYPAVTLRRLGAIVETLESGIELLANTADGINQDDRAAVDRWVLGNERD